MAFLLTIRLGHDRAVLHVRLAAVALAAHDHAVIECRQSSKAIRLDVVILAAPDQQAVALLAMRSAVDLAAVPCREANG